MPSAFDEEFLADASADFDEEFGEDCQYIPKNAARTPYSFTGCFESPIAERDSETQVDIDTERFDVVVLRSQISGTVQLGDRITRTSGSETLTYKVVGGRGKPDNEPDDGGEIYRRIRVQRIRACE